MSEISYGYCQCGCGGKTSLAPWNKPKLGLIKGEPNHFIHGHNGRGERNPNWKGGRRNSGYIEILKPGHPRATREYVKEHILIAEKALGKSLPPGAVVHHVNGSRDSGPLVICQDNNYHRLLHQRTRAYQACGHSGWLRCLYCKEYDDPLNMYVHPNKRRAYHSKCVNNYNKDLKERRKNGLRSRSR